MPKFLPAHFEDLRIALSELKATGGAGFEGLIAVTLEAITGFSFRLASSGYQRGVDGKTAFEGSIAFEGKLYTNNLSRTDVLSKIPDFVRHNNHADLAWVLGATCAVPAQLADDLRADGAKEGISVLVLDWLPADFPRLAVALAMGGEKVEGFLRKNLSSASAHKKATEALAAIRADSAFPRCEQAISKELNAPGIAMATAEKANAKWFSKTLANKALARSELGQPVAPQDEAVKVLARDNLTNVLSPYFNDCPSEDVICVHGEEGCGKSWIVIQSWLAQSDKPTLVFTTPDDFSEAATQEDIEARLITKLIAQTGDVEGNGSVSRWRRRLNAWEDSEKPPRPRLILVIDGINQRPDRAWGKVIDNVATYVNRRGGRVIFSARTHYFTTRLSRALNSKLEVIVVPKWSAEERDDILKHHNAPLNKLNPSVAEFLRNPRILSIALDVFGGDVASFGELHVERLLFEHIMAGVKEDFGEHPSTFMSHLRAQAKELSERVSAQVGDDLRIFQFDLPAVAEGRFYRAVPGEPEKYELRDEGLTLALGLSIIENMRKAERNSRSLDDALKEVLEPVEALDKTAEAMTAAITVCTADDDQYSPGIACTLIMGFVELQNPPSNSFPALVSFAKARPLAIAEAARELSLQSSHRPNFDWIEAALIQASTSPGVWGVIAAEVERWLRVYSLSPEHRMRYQARHEPPDKVEQERAKQQAEIDAKLAALSPAEEVRQHRLAKTEGNLDSLSRLAFTLLAGKELEPFATTLTDWCFSNALNGSFYVPTKDFLALIGLNSRDWQRTREALVKACEDLSTDTVSKTGKWARLRVLRATGDPKDDQDANTLYEELIEDRQLQPSLFKSEEKIEPCDPNAQKPVDLGKIVNRYQSLDTCDLRQNRGKTTQDQAFVNDRPVIARFALESAKRKHRQFADDVVNRIGMPLRQGLIELRKHGALITADQARALIAKWNRAQVAGDAQGLPEDEDIMLQYELLIAFPFLEAAEQLEVLLATSNEQPLLLELINETKTPDAQILDQFVEDASSSCDEYKQHLLLEIAAATRAELSNKIRALASTSLSSPVERLRCSALGIAAHSGHLELLKKVAESEWSSDSLEDKEDFETWYGSLALLKAAQAKLINQNTAFERISPRLYGRAAIMLDDPIVQEIANRLDASIRSAAELSDELVVPEIELEINDAASDEPTRFSLLERRQPSADIESLFNRLSESNEAFRERQKRNHDAFGVFREELTTAKARIILDHLTHEEFEAVLTADPTKGKYWYDLFMEVNDNKLPAVHNLILLLAGAIADTDPEKSAELLERAVHDRPLVRFTFGRSGVDLGSLSAWKGSVAPPLNALRRRRLNNAATDQAIAVEVFSALQCGQESFLEAYVAEQLASSTPAEIARGLMVAGFCDSSPHNDRVFGNYMNTAGLPGTAYSAAISAYRSNEWARHWFKRMCETEDPVMFWQAGILFTQCVDGRFSVWRGDFEQTGGLIGAFGSSLKNSLNERHEKLGKEREKRLFGQDAPAPIFVQRSE